uniref:Lactose synthase B protein n=1 Tax=Culicoides sonorensis TaxID=179676 RepID=A0A336KMA2_CULSO
MKFKLFWLTCSLVLALSEEKKYEKCELYMKLMREYNIEKNDAAALTCLAKKYSNYITNFQGVDDKNRNYYGIFTLPTKKVCSRSVKGGICDIKCSKLLNTNISDDLQCLYEYIDKSKGSFHEIYLNECYKMVGRTDSFRNCDLQSGTKRARTRKTKRMKVRSQSTMSKSKSQIGTTSKNTKLRRNGSRTSKPLDDDDDLFYVEITPSPRKTS